MRKTFRFVNHVFPALALATAFAPLVARRLRRLFHAPAAIRFRPGRTQQGSGGAKGRGGGEGGRKLGIQHGVDCRHVEYPVHFQRQHHSQPFDPRRRFAGFRIYAIAQRRDRADELGRSCCQHGEFLYGYIRENGTLHLCTESFCAQLRSGIGQPDGEGPHPGTGDSGSQREPVFGDADYRRLRPEIGIAGGSRDRNGSSYASHDRPGKSLAGGSTEGGCRCHPPFTTKSHRDRSSQNNVKEPALPQGACFTATSSSRDERLGEWPTRPEKSSPLLEVGRRRSRVCDTGVRHSPGLSACRGSPYFVGLTIS